jgi:hypothetical protein
MVLIGLNDDTIHVFVSLILFLPGFGALFSKHIRVDFRILFIFFQLLIPLIGEEGHHEGSLMVPFELVVLGKALEGDQVETARVEVDIVHLLILLLLLLVYR